MSTWEEEAVSFTANIRRSGSSYVITIPSELFHRFLLKEGQTVRVYGMTRKTPELQGMVGVFLGTFQVVEKYYGIRIVARNVEIGKGIKSPEEEPTKGILQKVEEIAEKYSATGMFVDVEDEKVEIRILFGFITQNSILKPKAKNDVKKIMDEITAEIKSGGGIISEAKIFEEKTEWHVVDPSLIAKSPYKDTEFLEWKWKI
ncbi:MAG: hypothetical protein B6U77_03115 [Candidatus Hecatellales archaeon ex4484_218]|nr:MAG: hypothetical protein B6U77_03115 [Candidatus Hecatellales archaeon ex4484_218]